MNSSFFLPGCIVYGKNWSLSFLSFRLLGDIPCDIFLVTETTTTRASDLYYFFPVAKNAFARKLQHYIRQNNESVSFEELVV